MGDRFDRNQWKLELDGVTSPNVLWLQVPPVHPDVVENEKEREREREREMLNGYGSDWVTDSNEIHGNRDWVGSQTRMARFLAQEFWLKIFWFKIS